MTVQRLAFRGEPLRFSAWGLPQPRLECIPTRWSTTLSSKVNLPHAINFRAFCSAKLVTYPADIRGVETLELHRVGGGRVGSDKSLSLSLQGLELGA